jgi:hypothetical protein
VPDVQSPNEYFEVEYDDDHGFVTGEERVSKKSYVDKIEEEAPKQVFYIESTDEESKGGALTEKAEVHSEY